MKLATIDIDQAIGGVLIHNIADAQGHKALHKGHRLTSEDIEKLRALGKTQVFVGLFDEGDIGENEAAARIAHAVAGENVTLSPVSTGRVNLFANARGLLNLNIGALDEINSIEGITIATIPAHALVEPKKMLATIKTIGLAFTETSLQKVEQIGQDAQGVIAVRKLPPSRVAVILTGSAEARAGVEKSLMPPIRGRVEELGSNIVSQEYVEHDAEAISKAVQRALEQQVDCVIIAGETSIMDASDVTPTGIVQAGGRIEVYGAPVEPGNLLLLAYANNVPIMGAPGCVKSRDTNVVDLILPRLLAGERVRKRDIVALANGGLLI